MPRFKLLSVAAILSAVTATPGIAQQAVQEPGLRAFYQSLGVGSGTSGTASTMASVRSSGSYASARRRNIMRARHRGIMPAVTGCDRVEKASGCSSPRSAEAGDKMLLV